MSCRYCENDYSDVVCYLPTDNGNADDLPQNYCHNCGNPLLPPVPLTLDKAINDYTDMLNAMGADTTEFIELVETINLVVKARESEKFNNIFDKLCEHRDMVYGKLKQEPTP